MRDFFTSGLGVDVAIAVIVLELLALVILSRSGRSPLGVVDVLGQLLAGVFLLLAVRCALRGADYRVTALMLAASFPVHIFDLLRRARTASRGPSSHAI